MIGKWLATASKRYFYIKLFIYTLLVAILPLLIISLVLYRNTTSVMQNELRTANEIYLKQTVDSMEMIVKQIGNSFQQTVLSGAIKEFETFPLGTYYEELKENYKDDELRVLYLYLSSKSNVRWYLDNLKRSNEFIQSVYFYDNTKKIFLTGTAQYAFDEFYDTAWSLSTEGIHAYPMISDVRAARQPDGSYKQVLPVIYMSSTQDNYIVINLDAEMIYSKLFRKFIRDDAHAFFVLSGVGRLMFYDRQYPISETMSKDPDLLRNIAEYPQKSFESEVLGKQLLVTNITSELLGWTFISATSVDEIYESVTNIKNLIWLTLLLLVSATGVLVFITSRHIYNPIRHLLSFITNKYSEGNGPPPGSKPWGELKMIRSSLEDAYDKQTKLQVRLKESLPAYKKMYIQSLLRPNRFAREEMAERLQFLGIRLEQEDLALMVVTVKEGEILGLDVGQEKMNKLHVEDLIQDLIPRDWNRIVMEVVEDQFVLIMNVHPGQMADVFEVAERIVRDSQYELGIPCTIGIGNVCPSLQDLPRAYEEAKEAQRYRIVTGDSDIIYIQDIRLENSPLLSYPKDKEIALNNYMINGETEQARHMFAEFVKDLKAQQGKVDFRQMQQSFIRLLGSMVETASGLRLDMEKILKRNTNLYETLLQMKELKDIVLWFHKMIEDFTSCIGSAYEEKNNKYVKQALQLMEQTFSDNISLTSIADRLQLSPSYFSRIFKEHTGQSFSEYVTMTRIEYSKRLLLESNLLVKEIGERTGYHKTNYFIKVFKECTGLTPGEYRKMHGTEDAALE